jgi:fructose-1-phosphate kinase PfkB-like protein
MIGGMVAGKAYGYPLEDCARLASALSADAITRVGSGLPSMAAVRALAAQVTVKEWT